MIFVVRNWLQSDAGV